MMLRVTRRAAPTPTRRRLAVSALALACCGSVAAAAASGAVAAASPRPLVVSLAPAPASLPAAGGTVTLAARVRHASRCTFRGQRRAGAVVVALGSVSCAGGRARLAVKIAPSTVQQVTTLRFSVVASGGGRTATLATRVIQAAYVPPPPPPPPLKITSSTTLPIGALGGAYSAALTASGGSSALQWALVGGAMPAGLALAPDGTISGVPAAPGTSTFTVQVQDGTSATAQAPITILVTGAAPPLAALSESQSVNWSGYFATGGPFTSVSATFDVPNVVPTATESDTSEWVGIDGANNSSLIQAGVEEFSTGNQVQVHAWWEILPDFEKFAPITVSLGDQVTVAIGAQPTGSFLIQIDDHTNGQRWQTTQPYFGQLTSAEWILEAPTNGQSNQIEALGVFSPPVTFSALGEVGNVEGLEKVVMTDSNGGPIATPSPLGGGGFTIAYGGGTPPPPG